MEAQRIFSQNLDFSSFTNPSIPSFNQLTTLDTDATSLTSKPGMVSSLQSNSQINKYNKSIEQQGQLQSTIKDFNNAYTSLGQWGDFGVQLGQQIGYSLGNKYGEALADTATGTQTTINAIKNLKSLNSLEKGTKGLNKARAGNLAAIAGVASDVASNFLKEKTEYEGDRGNITQSLDAAYDGISDALMSIPGWGMLAGGIMKGGALLGKGLNNLGGGTDGMTSVDAILGSSFFNLTPFGIINGFGGKTTSTIAKDTDVQSQIGSSYGGSYAQIDDAVHKSGKKYGLFSLGQFRKAQDLIADASRQQNIMTDIASDASDRFTLRNSSYAVNENRRARQMQGGYNQSSVRVGKNGLSVKDIIDKYKNTSFIQELDSIPEEFFEPYTVEEASIDSILPEFKEGGILTETSLDNIPEEFFEPLEKFAEGGKVNVIPEGALHARLHHMEDAENLTKKGIPVVSENENGELEQQAEIERNEIIFRLEVTKKLEELLKKYNESSQKKGDEIAIEAGKLLVEEILNNTIDNTGLLNTIN